jgi:hypothetical protein
LAQGTELERLAERRRVLVEESARLRQELAEHIASLKSPAAWVQRGLTLARAGGILWPVAAGVAGLMLTRRRGGWLGRLGGVWSLWQSLRGLRGLWR